MVRCSFKSHNSSKVCLKSVQWYPIRLFFLFPNVATFRGISGQTHGGNIKKSQDIYCIVLKERFNMCFLAKMYILDQS